MTTHLKLYTYISRAKVAQLYEQLQALSVPEKTVREDKAGDASAEARSGLRGILADRGKGEIRDGESVEQKSSVSTIQKLAKVVAHIEKHEDVGDLNDIMRGNITGFSAFCYKYRGKFVVLGDMPGRPGRFYARPGVHDASAVTYNVDGLYQIHGTTPLKAPGYLLSEKEFILPARLDNDFTEFDEDGYRLVSDISVLGSRTGDYVLQLACSYKYFSSMTADVWDNSKKEHYFIPDSTNAGFFQGWNADPYEGIVFITGVSGSTIMGTPLMLSHDFRSMP